MHVNTLALDETLHKQQAIGYLGHLPGAIFTDPYARSTARLYSVAIAPALALFDGDTGVRVARALSAGLFASAAFPTYLLAREVRLSRASSVAAGLASIALPWLALTTVLFTENLAYPLFVWAVWALVRALRDPSPRRDLLALVAILLCTYTRTELGCLLLVYVALAVARARGPRRTRRLFPFTAVLMVLVVLYVVFRAATIGVNPFLDGFLGPYRGITQRGSAPEMSVGLAVETGALVLGLGVLPAVLGAAWWAGRLARGREATFWPALAVIAVAVVLWGTSLFAQGGYLGAATEERYFFYLAPLLWVGALAALADGSVSRRVLLSGSAVCLALVALLPLVVGINPQTEFLAPVLSVTGNVTTRLGGSLGGVGQHDVLVLLVVGLAAAGAFAWHRRRLALLVLPVLVQLGLTGYAFATARGEVPGVPARTGGGFAQLAWADHALPHKALTTYIRTGNSIDRDLSLPFWNSAIRLVIELDQPRQPPANFPTGLLPTSLTGVAEQGFITAPIGSTAVQQPTSPLLQLVGHRRALSPDGNLELIDVSRSARARWAAQGRVDADGAVTGRVRLVARADSERRPFAAQLTLAAPAGTTTRVRVRMGGRVQTLTLGAAPQVVQLTACGPAEGTLQPMSFARLPDHRRVAAFLQSAVVRPLPGGPCRLGGPAKQRGR